jgi:hypothetical protein
MTISSDAIRPLRVADREIEENQGEEKEGGVRHRTTLMEGREREDVA